MTQPYIEIYTTRHCSFCQHAKRLLDSKGVEYIEYGLDFDPDERETMLQRSDGRRTVPQIFINNQHIGGYQDLVELESRGELDVLLGRSDVDGAV
ncbi:MAG: glutaredoxin 3 [Gammaproteobacteria bacterium]|nr:glutaredoxin 3 [Gammaproteobacteria bacterium]